MDEKINRFLYWAPRILSILFICVLILYSLDVFNSGSGFWETILGLFMHNIPAIFLLIILLISWKHELVGGIIFTVLGVLYFILTTINQQGHFSISLFLTISGPAILIGILFIINWIKKKKIINSERY
jgi:asparagine N-glycosylation enzyme membrane subunit Stt3